MFKQIGLFDAKAVMVGEPAPKLTEPVIGEGFDLKRFVESFAALASAEGGLKCLRGLALDLAVRGKLTSSQVSSDDCSGPFFIPSSWRWQRGREVFTFVTSGSRGWAAYYSDSGSIFLRIGNLDYEDIALDLREVQHVRPPTNAEGVRTRVEPGDVLISITGDTGMVGLVPPNLGEAYINQHIALARPGPLLFPEFVARALTAPSLLGRLQGKQRGIKNSLGLDDVREMRLPVPPLEEQRRIVAKVDELMRLIDDLEAQQAKARQAQTRFRVSALDALTRAAGPEELAEAWQRVAGNMEVLFERAEAVGALRTAIVGAAMTGKLTQRTKTDVPMPKVLAKLATDPSWRIPERESRAKLDPTIEALAGVVAVSDGWAEPRLNDVVQLINGRAYAQPELLAEGTPVIRIQNLNGGERWYYSDLTLPDRQYCDEGDLLFAWSASFGPYIWRGGRAIYHYHIWKLNLSSAVEKRFLYYSLLHLTDVVKEKSHGLAMLHITKGKMERWPLLLPPLEEQKRIVAKVESLMKLCDDLEARLKAKEATAARLVEAVVRELVAS